MIKRGTWPILPIVLGVSSALLTGCGFGDSSNDDAGIIVGVSEEVLATDPASGYDPGSWLLFNNVFQSLLRFPNGDSKPEPDAAKKCEFIDSKIQVYRCTLKEGLRFSNGDPLTAEDVKFSFDRLRRINDPAGPAVMFKSLDRVEVPDDKTVVFRLSAPDATFPSKIASGAGSIVDSREYPANALRRDHSAVGSGPYTMESFDRDQARFSVNKNYGGAVDVKNSGVTLKFFHNKQNALKAAVTEGDIDIAYRGLSSKDIANLKNYKGDSSGVNVVEGDSAEIQSLVFNMNDPVTGQLAVRQAIAYLIDRNSLVAHIYKDTTVPLYSIIPSGIAGHNTAFFDRYGGRPSRVLAESALRSSGIINKVKLTLWSTPSRFGPETNEELRAIARQLNSSKLFDVDVKSVLFSQYQKNIKAGKYGVYVKGWIPDYPDPDNFTAPFFGKGNVLRNNFENSSISDRFIPRTATRIDRSAATVDFAKIQNIVADRLPVLPLWQASQYVAVRENVRGYEYCLDPSAVFRFWELYKM